MSIGGVVIQFAVDTAAAVRDLAKFTRATDNIDSTLKGVDSDLDTTERSFDSLAAEIDATVASIKTDMTKLDSAVSGAATDVNTSAGTMKAQLGETGRETGAEFVANIAEGIGSGEASLTNVVQGTLGGLTNLAAAMTGPVGIAAGVAAGAIGLVFANTKKEAEEAAARLESLRGALQGIVDFTSKEAEAAIFDSWVESALEVEGQVESVAAVIEEAGVTAEEFQGALAGDPADLQTVNDKLRGRVTELGNQKRSTDDLTAAEEAYLRNVGLVYDAIGDTGGELARHKSEQKAISGLTQDTADDTTDWNDRLSTTVSKSKEVKDNIAEIPTNKNVNIHVKYTGKPPSAAGGWAPQPGVSGMMTPQVTMNVYASGALPTTPSELVALLESHNVRMGRKRAQPRSIAW